MGPGKACYLIFNRNGHQLVIGRVIRNLINAHAVTIKRFEFRRVSVGKFRSFKGLCGARNFSKSRQCQLRPAGAVTHNALLQCSIALPQILVTEVRRHIGDVVRR